MRALGLDRDQDDAEDREGANENPEPGLMLTNRAKHIFKGVATYPGFAVWVKRKMAAKARLGAKFWKAQDAAVPGRG